MRDKKELEVNGRAVTVHEMTVQDVMSWMRDLVEKENRTDLSPVAEYLLKDCSFDDLCRMTDLATDELEKFTPSELNQILEVAKSMNSFFFDLRSRILVTPTVAQLAA